LGLISVDKKHVKMSSTNETKNLVDVNGDGVFFRVLVNKCGELIISK